MKDTHCEIGGESKGEGRELGKGRPQHQPNCIKKKKTIKKQINVGKEKEVMAGTHGAAPVCSHKETFFTPLATDSGHYRIPGPCGGGCVPLSTVGTP